MTRSSLVLALVALFCLCGAASAQTTPPATASVAPVTVELVTTAVPAIETPAIDLAQIFAAPTSGGLTETPAPTWTSCTLSQCRAGCQQPGCFSYCIDMQTCECDVICH